MFLSVKISVSSVLRVENSDTTAPYSFNWTATQGSHTVKAVAFTSSGNLTSSTVSIKVGVNILKNPGFESSNLSVWQNYEQGVTLSRYTGDNILSAGKGKYYLMVSPRTGNNVISQDVKAALLAKGPGLYGIQSSISYKLIWGGTQTALKIVDSAGTHYYKSRGVTQYNSWASTCDNTFVNVSWTGTLQSAEFVVMSTDESMAADFPNPSVQSETYIDDCRLSFIS